MKKFLLVTLFLLGCDPEKENGNQCSSLEQKVSNSKEIAYGPNRCFMVIVVCIRGVQYYLFNNSNGKGGSPALKADGKPYTCDAVNGKKV